MISGRRSLARGRVTEPGDFVELDTEGLRSLVARDAELSEIFMRAFICGGCSWWIAGKETSF